MEFVIWSLASLALAMVLVPLVNRLGPDREEKRTHLFETENGERATPFSPVPADGDDPAATCCGCRGTLASESYRYCGSCFPAD